MRAIAENETVDDTNGFDSDPEEYQEDFSSLIQDDDEIEEELEDSSSEGTDPQTDPDTDEEAEVGEDDDLFVELDNSITGLKTSITGLNTSISTLESQVANINTAADQAVTVTNSGTFFHTKTSQDTLPYNTTLARLTNAGMNLGYYSNTADGSFSASLANSKSFTTLASYNSTGIALYGSNSTLDMTGNGIQIAGDNNKLDMSSNGIQITSNDNSLSIASSGIQITGNNANTIKITTKGIQLLDSSSNGITINGNDVSFTNGVTFSATETTGLFFVGNTVRKSVTLKSGENYTTASFSYNTLCGDDLSYLSGHGFRPVSPVQISTNHISLVKISGWNYNPSKEGKDTALTVSLTRNGASNTSTLSVTVYVQTLWVRASIDQVKDSDSSNSGSESGSDSPSSSTGATLYPIYGSYDSSTGKLNLYTAQSS